MDSQETPVKLYQFQSEGGILNGLLHKELGTCEFLKGSSLQNVIPNSFVYVREHKAKTLRLEVIPKSQISIIIDTKYIIGGSFQLEKNHIVYEDKDIIVLDKPEGISTQPTLKKEEDHLYGAVISYFTMIHPGNLAYIGLHHRLDRMTSGLVLMTKKPSMNKPISDQFEAKKIKKKYIAIVSGPKPKNLMWTIKESIAKVPRKGLLKVAIDPVKGQKAETRCKYIETLEDGRHVIECQPKTGRTHQIRIHLSHSGLPIVGDTIYGGVSHDRLLLHAKELGFSHPRTGESVNFISEKSLY